MLGTVRTHVVRATNTGWFPSSFQVERDDIHHHGFHVELDRVRNLPGAPDHETVDFVVSFDPRGANLQLGPVESVVPINVSMINVLKSLNTFHFLFSKKMWICRAGIHNILSEYQTGNTLIRLLLQKQSDLGLSCLSRPFWQVT